MLLHEGKSYKCIFGIGIIEGKCDAIWLTD